MCLEDIFSLHIVVCRTTFLLSKFECLPAYNVSNSKCFKVMPCFSLVHFKNPQSMFIIISNLWTFHHNWIVLIVKTSHIIFYLIIYHASHHTCAIGHFMSENKLRFVDNWTIWRLSHSLKYWTIFRWIFFKLLYQYYKIFSRKSAQLLVLFLTFGLYTVISVKLKFGHPNRLKLSRFKNSFYHESANCLTFQILFESWTILTRNSSFSQKHNYYSFENSN
jgi:hypothetical protein